MGANATARLIAQRPDPAGRNKGQTDTVAANLVVGPVVLVSSRGIVTQADRFVVGALVHVRVARDGAPDSGPVFLAAYRDRLDTAVAFEHLGDGVMSSATRELQRRSVRAAAARIAM